MPRPGGDPAMGYYPGWSPGGCAAGPQDSRAYQGVTPQNFPDFGAGAGHQPLPGDFNLNLNIGLASHKSSRLDNSLAPTPQPSIPGSSVQIPGFPGSSPFPDMKPQTLPTASSVVDWDKIYTDSAAKRDALKKINPYSDIQLFGLEGF
jgi:hypothetical protein